MNILVLNGSPKKDKSDTMHITNAFLEGMNQSAGNEITVVHTVEKSVHYCNGCLTCMRGNGQCTYKDDMSEILQLIHKCDVLILSFPLYCYGMPASLKAVIDRILPLSRMTMRKVGDRYEHEERNDYSNKRYVMICGCGFPNSKNNFEAAIIQFQLMFGTESTVITIPESPLFNISLAQPVTEPRLELVKQAGQELMEKDYVSSDLLQKLSIPMIPEEDYAKGVNEVSAPVPKHVSEDSLMNYI